MNTFFRRLRFVLAFVAVVVLVSMLIGYPRLNGFAVELSPPDQPLPLKISTLRFVASQLSAEEPTPMTVEINGSLATYDVVRSKVLSADARVRMIGADGTRDIELEVNHIKGYRRGGAPGDVLAVSYSVSESPIWIRGVIRDSGVFYSLEVDTRDRDELIAARVDPTSENDELHDTAVQCDQSPFPPEVAGESAPSGVPDSPYSPRSLTVRRVQLATIAANDFTLSQGGAAQANAEIQAVINAVNSIYENDLNYQITIVSQHAWESPDPFSGNQVQPIIDQLRSNLNPTEGGISTPYDVAQLVTSRALYNGQNVVLGYAWGPICDPSALSVVRWVGGFNVRRTTVAHEIGHNLGAYHDTTNQYVMSPVNGGQDQFSVLSRDTIHAFSDGAHCVDRITDPSSPPGAPAIVVAQRSLSPADTSVRLTIRAPASGGAVSTYQIFRSMQPQGCVGAPIAIDVIGERFRDESSQGSSTYYYSALAINPYGTSPCSNVYESVAPPTPYATGPIWGAIEEASPSPFDRLTFRWSGFTNAHHYNVFRSIAPVSCPGSPYATGITGTEFIDTGINYGTRYFYSFRAVNTAGESDCAGPFSLSLPEPVTAQATLVEGGQVRIAWGNSSLARSYPVHVSIDGEVTWNQIGWLPTGGSIVHTPTLGTNPLYRVLTCNASGCSFSPTVAPSFSWNNTAWLLTNPSYYEIRSTALSLPEFAHQVRVERSVDGANFQTILNLTPAQALAGSVDPSPLEGTLAYYRLLVCSVAHCTPSTIRSIPIPSAVALQASNNRSDGVELTFGVFGQPSATRYLVYWSRTNNGSDWTLLGEAFRGGSNTVTYLHSNADANGTPQYYRVRSCSLSGCALSNLASGVVRVPPTIVLQPQGVNVSVGAQASFSVAAEPTALLSHVWRRNGQMIPGATSSSLLIPSVELSDLGDYTVVVTNSLTGLSVTSAAAPLGLIVAPPGNLDAEFLESLSGVRVSWAAVPGATQYTVFRMLGDSSPCPTGAQTWVTTGLSLNDTTAAPGVVYRYSVRATPSQGLSSCSLNSVAGMRTLALIVGAVRLNGLPLLGVGVTIPGITTVLTDSSGTFRIHLGGTGPVTLVPSLAGYAFNPPSQSIVVTAGTNSASTFNATDTSSSSSSSPSTSSSVSSSSSTSSVSTSTSSSSAMPTATPTLSSTATPTATAVTPSPTPTSPPVVTTVPTTVPTTPLTTPTPSPTAASSSSSGIGSSQSMSGGSSSSASSSASQTTSSSSFSSESSSVLSSSLDDSAQSVPECRTVSLVQQRETLAQRVFALGRFAQSRVQLLRRGPAFSPARRRAVNRAITAIRSQVMSSQRHTASRLALVPSMLDDCTNTGQLCTIAPLNEISQAVYSHEISAYRRYLSTVNRAIQHRYGSKSSLARSQRRVVRTGLEQRFSHLQRSVITLSQLNGLCL